MHDFTIHRQSFNLPVGKMQNRAAGSFVNAAALHSDEAILDNVDATDAMFAAKSVQRLHNAQRRERFAVHFHAVSVLEPKIDIFRLVRRVFRRNT